MKSRQMYPLFHLFRLLFLLSYLIYLLAASLALASERSHGWPAHHSEEKHRQHDDHGHESEKHNQQGYASNRNHKADEWGNRGGGDSSYGREWNEADARHSSHDRGSKAYDKGRGGWADENRREHHHDNDGHHRETEENGERATQDAGGGKRFSYFAEGNGPDGFYSRGIFGSDDYEHEAAKKAESHRAAGEKHDDSNHGGHKTHAHGSMGHDHGAAYHHFDDIGARHSAESLGHGNSKDHHHEEGWKASNSDSGWQNNRNNFRHAHYGARGVHRASAHGYPIK